MFLVLRDQARKLGSCHLKCSKREIWMVSKNAIVFSEAERDRQKEQTFIFCFTPSMPAWPGQV